jgi:ABC-type uncharacterized transport system involved in gliding motility auxiliary subunit
MRLDRKMNSRTAAWVGTLAVIVLLAAAALVSQLFVHGRVDLTRDREFTLSPASLKALRELPGKVTARVVMSRDLPARFQQARTRAVDLLREFEARSEGRFVLVFEDPGSDTLKRQAALSMGIEEVQLQEQSREGLQVKKGFFGIALLRGENKEVFPVLQNLETLEYDLIVRLMRLTRKPRVVGVVEGAAGEEFTLSLQGEEPRRGFAANFPALTAGMRQLYDAQALRLDIIPVPDSVSLLLVAAPRRLTEIEKFRIDQFAMSGRPVIFLTPGMNVDLSTGVTAVPAEDGYADLLAHYGVTVRADLVLEPRQWEMVRFGDALFTTPYPYWIVPGYQSLDGENPVTASLQSLSFPWASSLTIVPSAQPGARIDVLARTSDEAWSEEGPQNLYPRELREYEPGEQGALPLAALVTGPLTSHYSVGAPFDATPAEANGILRESKGDARVLVVGHALFASDFYLSYTHAMGNLHFVLNALDYLALDPDLIGVRSRQIADVPLDEEKVARLKHPAILANLLFIPLLLMAVAAVAAVRRRRRRTSA